MNSETIKRKIKNSLRNFNKESLREDAKTLINILVLCQSLIEGYSFLSLIRASSVVNRQWTVVPC